MSRPLTDARPVHEIHDVLMAERRGRHRLMLQVGGVLAIITVCLWVTGMLDGGRLAEGLPAIGVLFSEMFPPDFGRWRAWVGPMVETLAMSVAGTALALLFSVPLAFLAARNTAPNGIVFHGARFVLNALRSIPELIMGIVFVAAVGFGMLPGVLALGLHSVGMVGAGGIGTELVGSLRLLDYQQVSALLIVILATVTVVDALSNVLRQRFK